MESSAGDAPWKPVGTGDDRMVVYADRATIRKPGDVVKMRVLLDYKTAQRDDSGKPYLSAKPCGRSPAAGIKAATKRFHSLTISRNVLRALLLDGGVRRAEAFAEIHADPMALH